MPVNRPQRLANRSHRPGATIGDGMVATARAAGAATALTVLVNAGPMLLAGIGGSLFLLRGCLWSPSPAPQPTHTLAPQPLAAATVHPTSIATASVQPSVRTLRPSRPVGDPRLDRQALDVTPYEILPEEVILPQEHAEPLRLAQPGGFFAMGPGFHPAANPMFSFPPGNNSIMGMIAEPPSANDPPTFEESPLFDLKRGRKFLGTCQMPGSPSKRVSLSLGAIREGGRNIEAKLSLLESPRTTKAFTGVIEKNPHRLTLTPDLNPTSFGTFLTYMPWYSNSPTKITLSISEDGKLLSGTSVASEEFEFLPQERSSSATRTRAPMPIDSFAGFDDASKGGTDWKVTSSSSESTASTSQIWSFAQISDGEGSFIWRRDGNTIASGTYLENQQKKQLDIVLTHGQESRTYRGIFKPIDGSQERVQICISKIHDDERPKRMGREEGNLFELEANDSKDEP